MKITAIISCFRNVKQNNGSYKIQKVDFNSINYGTMLKDSARDLFNFIVPDGVITQTWHEYDGEEVDFSLAKPKQIEFTIKVFGTLESVSTLANEVKNSLGTDHPQHICIKWEDEEGKRTYYIHLDAECTNTKISNTLSRSGVLQHTYATLEITFKIFDNKFNYLPGCLYTGICGDFNESGYVTPTYPNLRQTTQINTANRFLFFDLTDKELNDFQNVTSLDAMVEIKPPLRLYNLGWLVLKGYYQNMYAPALGREPLNINYIGGVSDYFRCSKETANLSSGKEQGKDVKLILHTNRLQKGRHIMHLIDVVGYTKRYLYRATHEGRNLIFIDTTERKAFACYVKNSRVNKLDWSGYIEIELTLRNIANIAIKI